VLLSPASKDSTWVTREIGYAESYGIRIFPILIRGDQRTFVPLRLTSTQRIDARQDYQAAVRTLVQALRRYRKGGSPDLVAPPPDPQASPKPLAIKRLVIAGVAALLLIAVLFGVAVLVPVVIEELAKRFEGDSGAEVTPSAVPQVTESSGAEDETTLTPPGLSELQWITSAETSALSGPNGAFWDKYQAVRSFGPARAMWEC
jgi:hypothetical protein